MPAEVVGEILRPAIELPATAHLEGVVVDDEDAPRTVTGWRAQGADIDAVRSAVTRMRAAVSGAVGNFLGLDRLDDPRRPGIRLGVDHVDPGRPNAGSQEI